MIREDYAWAAGFFDGEGTAAAHLVRDGKYLRAQMAIKQVDRQVLDRFAALMGGSVVGPYDRGSPNHRPIYIWSETGLPECQAIVALMWEWLGPVKRAQCSLMLHRDNWAKNRPRFWVCQKHGREFIESRGARHRCGECRREGMRRRYRELSGLRHKDNSKAS